MDLLQNLEYWHWLLLGVILALLEIFSPGVFLLWIGIGAGVTGLVLLLIPDLAWQVQLVAFALFSFGAIVAAKVFLSAHPLQSDQPNLNRRGEQYVGRTFTLQQAVVNGEGKIRVDDSTWKIHGSDCPAGTRVRVVGVNGVVLQVEAAD
jgi:membrane protein implicated in regulation of membrane protease activity